MIIIASPGFYQVNAMLGDVNLRIRKKSEFYSHHESLMALAGQ